MADILTRYWWVVLIRGLAAIAFGALAFLSPGITLASLIVLFGLFALVDGILLLVAAFQGRRADEDWWLGALRGVLGILIAGLTFRNPALTALVLVFYIASWALAGGVLEIAIAIRLRDEIEGEWLLGLAGLASIAFAGLLLWSPGAGAIAMLWWIAAWAAVTGALLVVESFLLRGLGTRHADERAAAATP